jgi:hypothetical protein
MKMAKMLGYHWAVILPKRCAFGKILYFVDAEKALKWRRELGGRIVKL